MSTDYAIRDHGIYGTLPTGDVVDRFATLDEARRAWHTYRRRIHGSHHLTLREEWMGQPTGPALDPALPEPTCEERVATATSAYDGALARYYAAPSPKLLAAWQAASIARDEAIGYAS